jgi:hypothetical protein
MSRSLRKTPFFGMTHAASEAADKRAWHQRWRSRQRDQLARVGADDDPLPVSYREVSSTWCMAKDGKRWFGPRQQAEVAQWLAQQRCATLPEQAAMRERLLARWRRK